MRRHWGLEVFPAARNIAWEGHRSIMDFQSKGDYGGEDVKPGGTLVKIT